MQFILSDFVERLEEQMLLNELTTKTLAQKTNIDKSTISAWRRREYSPSTQNFLKLVEFFNCSADYLVGLVEFPSDNVTYHTPVYKYGKILRSLLATHKVSQEKFLESMNLSSNLLYKWLTDKNVPSVENLVRIAQFFEISLDTLIGRVK